MQPNTQTKRINLPVLSIQAMTNPERVAASTRSFLEDHPDLEDALRTLLDHEQTSGSWGFDDTPLGSGRFGELVSREFVKPTDGDAYRFADRETVKSVLEGDAGTTTATTSGVDSPDFDISLPEIDVRLAGMFTAALALVVVDVVAQNGLLQTLLGEISRPDREHISCAYSPTISARTSRTISGSRSSSYS